jgi:carbamoyl-phosphate synthase/aspartate carbamoyltransferase/dihydroorotase
MSLLRLPGLIDPHVHLREPGSTHKEDFDSGTAAALAGGFVAVLDMPNNTPPTVTPEALDEKLRLAAAHARCDIGFHFGATAENAEVYSRVAERCFGLKIYMNSTHGTLLVTQLQALMRIFERWPHSRGCTGRRCRP